MPDNTSVEYINSTDYQTLLDRIKELDSLMDDNQSKNKASRKLRFTDIDIAAERAQGRFQPDELYVPQHIIDTNIRREQSAYVQFVTQSPRAVICEDVLDPTVNNELLDQDLTKKLRYDGWQLEMFSNIDGFQANGYGIMELILDQNNPGEVGHERVQYGDFAFLSDTRDLQAVEMTSRSYYFTKTRLDKLSKEKNQNPEDDWNVEQLQKLMDSSPSSSNVNNSTDDEDTNNKSLYKIKKQMFRVGGIVHVAWCCPEICNDWLRKPRPLFLGHRKLTPPPQPQGQPQGQIQVPGQAGANKVPIEQQAIATIMQGGVPPSEEQYETNYPYFLFPYLISENDTITQLKGRVFLDQDIQEAVSSLLSSTVTKARRSAGLYFSKDVDDPNDDILMQKNVFFRSGSILNKKVTEMALEAPDPAMFSAIQMLVSMNQNETSQVNFAVNNRKDSRKTAKEIEVASTQAQILSTVQVVLFSLALRNLYTSMVDIIRSRVLAGLIKVNQQVLPLYSRTFTVKPSGDTDVIEKQQLIQTMMSAWPVVQNTPCAQQFLTDLINLMFPQNAAKYIQTFMQAQQAQQSQQAQQQQQQTAMFGALAKGVVTMSKEPDMFSDKGKLHLLPVLKNTAQQFEDMQKQQEQQQLASGQQRKAITQ